MLIVLEMQEQTEEWNDQAGFYLKNESWVQDLKVNQHIYLLSK